MPNNENNTTKIPEEFKTFLEWKSIVVDSFADLDSRAVVFLTPRCERGVHEYGSRVCILMETLGMGEEREVA